MRSRSPHRGRPTPASGTRSGSRTTRIGRPAIVPLLILSFAPLLLNSVGIASVTGGASGICRFEPRVLDVSRRPGPLTVRIELPPAQRFSIVPPARAIDPGVYISSVNGRRLPAPSDRVDGIEEDASARRFEDRFDLRTGRAGSNGLDETVVRFNRPSDGIPKTRGDGDAGDLLAMLLDQPDGTLAEVCVAGSVGGTPFEFCDHVMVRNRGLRDLPAGLPAGRRGARP